MIGRDALFFALCLVVVGGLLITQAPRATKPVIVEEKAAEPVQDKVTVQAKPEDKTSQVVPAAGNDGSEECDKELRRTADLLRFYANRIQGGEEAQSVVADMRQQEKKITAACPNR